MSLTLYAHPFSSYCQKVLMALYENDTAFEYRMLGSKETDAELEKLWPVKRFPVLVDNGRTVMEASIIIEHLQLYHPGPVKLIPDDAKKALDMRMMDRFFDNYIMTPMQKIVFNAIRQEDERDPHGITQARAMLDTSYRWLDNTLEGREWAAGNSFSAADCAAAPSLFYADWVHPIGEEFSRVRAYRQRLLVRPSFAKAVDEARPYRHFFPLGAPDRD
jgi:glutathione S-transferase